MWDLLPEIWRRQPAVLQMNSFTCVRKTTPSLGKYLPSASHIPAETLQLIYIYPDLFCPRLQYLHSFRLVDVCVISKFCTFPNSLSEQFLLTLLLLIAGWGEGFIFSALLRKFVTKYSWNYADLFSIIICYWFLYNVYYCIEIWKIKETRMHDGFIIR